MYDIPYTYSNYVGEGSKKHCVKTRFRRRITNIHICVLKNK